MVFVEIPTLCQFISITIANEVNKAIHSEDKVIKVALVKQLVGLPSEMILMVCTFLSPFSLLTMEEELLTHGICLDTSPIWKRFCKRWDAANEHARNLYQKRNKKRIGEWKNKFWERALRTCFNEINLVRSRWIVSNPLDPANPNYAANLANSTSITNLLASAEPTNSTITPNTTSENSSNSPTTTTNFTNSTNSENSTKITNSEDENPHDSSKWVLGSNCVVIILKPMLPKGILFSYVPERPTKIWMFEEFVDMCAEFINEVRLINIIISMNNIPHILQKLKNLRCLTMSYARSKGIWGPIVDILKSTKHITELILEYVFLDDLCPIWDALIEIGTPLNSIFINTGNLTGCKQFSKLISSTKLRELTLWDINFETDSETEFFSSLSSNTSLTYLDIEEINLSGGPELMNHISNLISLPQGHLTHLDFTECMLYPLEITQICEALERNSCIRVLNFSSNFLDVSGAAAIASLLSTNSTITSLAISDCKLEQFGLEKLISGLANSKVTNTLQVLDISCNFGARLGECWAKLLTSCSALRKLNLESTQLGTVGLRDDFLESLRNHPSLSAINFSANRLGDIGLLKLLPILSSNLMLQKLNLSGNLITPAGGNAIATAFPNREIRSLDLRRNLIGAAAQRIRKLPGIAKLLIGYNDERVICDGVQEV